jgi:hypothetical protein
MKLVWFIKISLNEAYSIIFIGKHLSNNFHIQNALEQGDALPPLHLNFALEYDLHSGDEIATFISRPISLLASVKHSVFFFIASKSY